MVTGHEEFKHSGADVSVRRLLTLVGESSGNSTFNQGYLLSTISGFYLAKETRNFAW